MSRSNYSDDLDVLELGRWRGRVASAMRGRRGQKFLRDLVAALDAMPVKELIAHELVTPEGEVCAIGSVGVCRGIDMSKLDPEEPEEVAAVFDIAEPLAREIVHMNDEWGGYNESCEQRWKRMREWAAKQIRPVPGESSGA